MRYRPEIDGLRAVAVLPVIAFHAGFPGAAGGFVGVDVFFVISGYLISTLILADLARGHFSLTDFYERRARRILPALFVVMAVSAAVAWVTLMPKDMAAFSRSVVATVLFGSNLLFWKETGYFDTASELKPLLHTWSLAIEEQFYIFFPLLLMLVWARARRALVPLLALAFAISLGLAQWGAVNKPSSAFFLLPTRAWELLLGVFCALALRRGIALPRRLEQAGGLAGLAMIAGAVAFYDHHTSWPGLPALLPTLGTALIILCAQPGTLAAQLLSLRGLVALGLVSYSAYLWHQPLFAFARYRSIAPPTETAMLGLTLVTLVLAWASWRYVERPFRRAGAVSRARIFAGAGAGLAAFALLGLSGALTQGFPKARIPAEVAALAAYAHDDNPLRRDCFSGPSRPVPPEAACVLGDASSVRGVLLGDSHSDAIAWPLHKDLQARGVGLKHMWLNGCPPVRGIDLLGRPAGRTCQAFNDRLFDVITADRALEYVVLSARFTIYLEGETYDNGEGGVEPPGLFAAGRAGQDGAPYPETQRQADVAALYRDSVRELLAAGKTVILLYPVPEQGWNVPMDMAKRLFFTGSTHDISVSKAHFDARNRALIATFDGLGHHPRLKRVRPSEVFCDTFLPGRCMGSWDKVPFYYDDDHLSNTGAALLTPRIASHIGPVAPELRAAGPEADSQPDEG